MRQVDLPSLSDRPLPAVGIGAMALSDPGPDGEPMSHEAAVTVLHRAFDLGMTLVDTADIYAPDAVRFGHNERLVGEAVRSWSGGRDALTVVTKIGITRTPGPHGDEWGRDGSAEYLLAAAEASAQRLGFVPDAVLLHRVNRTQQPFERTAAALARVREAGYAARVGIGNVHLDECETALDVLGVVAAVENERSPRYRRHGDVLDWCRVHGVAYLPWSPLGHDARRLGETYPAFADVASEQSASRGEPVTAQEVALAWLSASGPVLPIPGSTRTATVESSARAAGLELTDDQVARLDASPSQDGSVFPD